MTHGHAYTRRLCTQPKGMRFYQKLQPSIRSEHVLCSLPDLLVIEIFSCDFFVERSGLVVI